VSKHSIQLSGHSIGRGFGEVLKRNKTKIENI